VSPLGYPLQDKLNGLLARVRFGRCIKEGADCTSPRGVGCAFRRGCTSRCCRSVASRYSRASGTLLGRVRTPALRRVPGLDLMEATLATAPADAL